MKNKDKNRVLNKVARALLNKKKVVFLFGAGASMPSGIPGTQRLKDLLFKEEIKPVVQTFEELAKGISVDFDRLRLGDLSSITFEQLLTLVYGSKEKEQEYVAEWLGRNIPDVYTSKVKYLPSIAYEFVSHLMGNGLVRYVINFNYDEILDKVIDDELGKGKCCRIVTTEEFERLSIRLDKGESWDDISNYFLFKPHGTRSMRGTLRFRVEDVFRFEKPKANVLKDVFKESLIIMVGYGAEDLDFQSLFRELYTEKKENIIVVRKHPEVTRRNLNNSKEILEYKGHSDNFFESLARTLYGDDSSFKEQYEKYYTKATRHFIRAKINEKLSPFSTKPEEVQEKKDAQEAALESNPLFFEELSLVIEILIYCFKVRGLFIRDALMSCNRVKSALSAYLEKTQTLKEEKYAPNPIEKILSELRQKKILHYDDSKKVFDEIWCYMPLMSSDRNKDSRQLFEKMTEKIFERYLFRYLRNFVQGKGESLKEDLKKHISSLPYGFDYDLLPSDVSLFYIPLRNINQIASREDFRNKTEEILKMATQGALLYVISPCVAEWLYKWGKPSLASSNRGKIKVLLSKDILDIKNSLHYKHAQPTVKGIKELLPRGNIKYFRGISNALTLAFEKNGDSITGKAILFSRKGKASSFSPVCIEENNVKKTISEINKLKDYFDDLFEKKLVLQH